MVRKANNPYSMILKLTDPLEIFDLICANNYFAGHFNAKIPVDESRKCFERIKILILRKAQHGKS